MLVSARCLGGPRFPPSDTYGVPRIRTAVRPIIEGNWCVVDWELLGKLVEQIQQSLASDQHRCSRPHGFRSSTGQ